MPVYRIRLADGIIIETVTEAGQAVGDCVRISHGTDLSAITPQSNFVPARLERASGC
jgi:hypothetical protein